MAFLYNFITLSCEQDTTTKNNFLPIVFFATYSNTSINLSINHITTAEMSSFQPGPQLASNLTPDHGPPPFQYSHLPLELRLLVLCYSVPVQADSNSIPPMLAGLANNSQLHPEAVEIYGKVNVVVTPENQHAFKYMKMKNIFRLTGIRLVYNIGPPG